MVARERFELSSAGPKPAMLDHYTTGLHAVEKTTEVPCNNFNVVSSYPDFYGGLLGHNSIPD